MQDELMNHRTSKLTVKTAMSLGSPLSLGHTDPGVPTVDCGSLC